MQDAGRGGGLHHAMHVCVCRIAALASGRNLVLARCADDRRYRHVDFARKRGLLIRSRGRPIAVRFGIFRAIGVAHQIAGNRVGVVVALCSVGIDDFCVHPCRHLAGRYIRLARRVHVGILGDIFHRQRDGRERAQAVRRGYLRRRRIRHVKRGGIARLDGGIQVLCNLADAQRRSLGALALADGDLAVFRHVRVERRGAGNARRPIDAGALPELLAGVKRQIGAVHAHVNFVRAAGILRGIAHSNGADRRVRWNCGQWRRVKPDEAPEIALAQCGGVLGVIGSSRPVVSCGHADAHIGVVDGITSRAVRRVARAIGAIRRGGNRNRCHRFTPSFPARASGAWFRATTPAQPCARPNRRLGSSGRH